LKTNNWGAGLPPANGNQEDWDIIGPALADPNLKPTGQDIRNTFLHTLEMLVIRKSTGLFRLRTAEDIKKSVSFYNAGPNQIPGLIVERIVGKSGSCTPAKQAVVLVNATPQSQTFSDAAFKRQPLILHPVQIASYDPVVRKSKFNSQSGTFTIPARTVAVFIEPCFGWK
jgi:hypothetical protein